jgi:hypothetical protein
MARLSAVLQDNTAAGVTGSTGCRRERAPNQEIEAPIAVEFERSRQGSRRAKEINAWRERESTQVLTSRNTALRPRRWWRCCIAGMH